jgi:hypothetical protein
MKAQTIEEKMLKGLTDLQKEVNFDPTDDQILEACDVSPNYKCREDVIARIRFALNKTQEQGEFI